jgi:hypothetical protein
MKPEPKRPVAIEDLLRLKRTERPLPAFWSEFDRSLRAKQLAALVAKRPWWHSLPSPLALISRHRVPFGAAAAFAFTVLAVREYRASAPASIVPAGDFVVQTPATVASQPSVAVEGSPLAVVASGRAVTAPEVSPIESITVVATAGPNVEAIAPTLAALSHAPETVPAATASVASQASISLGRVPRGSDIVVPARLAAAGATFEARPAPAVRAVVDPLQQMTPPGESRRNARLLAAMASPVSVPPASRGSERAASRISEETLYEQVSRFGARGDRFNVKF